MKEISLTANERENIGKGFARRARVAGNIPGVVYGPEIAPIAIAIDKHEFREAWKSATSNSIFNLNVNGKKNKVVLREIQRDPVTSKVIHLDFHAISMTRPIKVRIPISLVGVPEGVKTDGGIMQTTLRELDIYSLMNDIPDKIEIDVSDLGIGDSLHVSDLDIKNVTILSDLDRTIVVISAPTVVKAVSEEAEEGEELEEGEEVAAEGEGEASTEDESSESKDTKKE
ncbi:MAG: 50S ribosomal protein L25 [candidate division Zixibacteria bacterium]|nr:50S ribosomal protein L25 [candidate division Zixibacteria bacterium]